MLLHLARVNGRKRILVLTDGSDSIVVATIEQNTDATWTVTTDAHLTKTRQKRSHWRSLNDALGKVERWGSKYRDRHLKGC